MNCLHSLGTKPILNHIKKVCENKEYCDVTMSCAQDMLPEFTQHLKSIKAPFLIHADLKRLIKKIKKTKSNYWAYLVSTICEFYAIKDKHYVYRGKGYRKKFGETLKEHVMKIIDF